MKQRMLCILLTLCMVLSVMPVFGTGSVGGTADSGYGLLYLLAMMDDEALGETVVVVRMLLPDGSYKDYSIPASATVDGETYTDLDALYSYLEENAAYTAFSADGNDYITEISLDTSAGTSYTELTYSETTGTFSNLPASAADLPVYYSFEGTPAAPYLDEEHLYDVCLYDYAIEITSMTAADMEGTIQLMESYVTPNADFLLNLNLACTFAGNAAGIGFNLFDKDGNRLTSGFNSVVPDSGTVVFWDLPNEDAVYTVEVWLEDANSSRISPYYETTVTTKAMVSSTGEILNTLISDGAWDNEKILYLQIEDTKNGELYECQVASTVYINGYEYTDAEEMYALLPAGTVMEYIGNEDGELAAVRYESDKELFYGKLIQVASEAADTGGGIVKLLMMLPDGSLTEYTMTEESWIDGHLQGSIDGVVSVLENAMNSYTAFAKEENAITWMEISSNQAIGSYINQSYSASAKKFSGLPKSAEGLPIYYLVDGFYAEPYLDGNHTYSICLYEHAIEIYEMTAKNMAGTIRDIQPFSLINENFQKDIDVNFTLAAPDNSVLKAELLSGDGRSVLREYSGECQEVYSTVSCFQNLPNQDADYRLKAWLEDSTGTKISPVYHKAFSVEETPVSCGTITDASIFTDEWNNSYLRLTLSVPGSAVPATVLCHPWTLVNGVDYSADYDTALENIQTVLPVGTMVEYAIEDDAVSVLRTLSAMQAVTAATHSGTTVTASVYLATDADAPATGIVYGGVYSKEGILKKLITADAAIDSAGTNVPLTIEGVSYAEGDYVKAFFWDENDHAISNTAELTIE